MTIHAVIVCKFEEEFFVSFFFHCDTRAEQAATGLETASCLESIIFVHTSGFAFGTKLKKCCIYLLGLRSILMQVLGEHRGCGENLSVCFVLGYLYNTVF